MPRARRMLPLTLDGQPAAWPVLGLAGERLPQADADDALLQGELQRVEAQQFQPELSQRHIVDRAKGQPGLRGTASRTDAESRGVCACPSYARPLISMY